jgi:hypothetical protein
MKCLSDFLGQYVVCQIFFFYINNHEHSEDSLSMPVAIYAFFNIILELHTANIVYTICILYI